MLSIITIVGMKHGGLRRKEGGCVRFDARSPHRDRTSPESETRTVCQPRNLPSSGLRPVLRPCYRGDQGCRASSERSSATAESSPGPTPGVPQVLPSQTIPHVPGTPFPVTRERIGSIDLLRILAAVGIIWFHVEGAPGRQIGYAGLPVFLLIFFSFVSKQAAVNTTASYLQRRRNRLLEPWLFWFAVYGSCRLVKAVFAADWSALDALVSWETFLAGPYYHLWYLPYAFLAGLLVHSLSRRMSRANGPAVVAGATLLGVLALAGCSMHMSLHALPRPLPQWEFGLAAIPLGVAIGRCLMSPSRRRRNLLLSLVGGATAAAGTVLGLLGLGESAVPYGLAVSLVCLAYGWQIRNNGWIAALAPLTLGIYLVHPLVIREFRQVFAPEQNYAVFMVLTAIISGLITLGLTRTPLRRFV